MVIVGLKRSRQEDAKVKFKVGLGCVVSSTPVWQTKQDLGKWLSVGKVLTAQESKIKSPELI